MILFLKINKMERNIIDVINYLGELDKLYSVGEVDPSKIAQAAKRLGVEFAKDFVEYTQKYGSISVGEIELCGIDDDRDTSIVEQTKKMRRLYSNFPRDCYVVERLGIEDDSIIQNPDGKIYLFTEWEKEPQFVANSLSEYLLKKVAARDTRSEHWKARAND